MKTSDLLITGGLIFGAFYLLWKADSALASNVTDSVLAVLKSQKKSTPEVQVHIDTSQLEDNDSEEKKSKVRRGSSRSSKSSLGSSKSEEDMQTKKHQITPVYGELPKKELHSGEIWTTSGGYSTAYPEKYSNIIAIGKIRR